MQRPNFDISNKLLTKVILVYNPNLNTQLDFINLYKNNKLFSNDEIRKISGNHNIEQQGESEQEKQK